MKWGVRRYQTKDGDLTPAGRKRYNRDYLDNGGDKQNKFKPDGSNRKVYEANPNKWVRDDLNRTRRLADETGNLTRNVKNMNDTSMRNKPKAKMDLSQMSDKEMRDQINRALLEKQYNDLFAPQKVSKGQERLSKTLEVAGGALAVTSSALGIALAIKELKG